MSEQLDALQRRVAVLQRSVALLVVCAAGLSIYLFLFAPRGRVQAVAQIQSLTIKRLAIVDDNGTERVVVAAPLPDPLILGKRVKRDGPVSGILIFDPKGN